MKSEEEKRKKELQEYGDLVSRQSLKVSDVLEDFFQKQTEWGKLEDLAVCAGVLDGAFTLVNRVAPNDDAAKQLIFAVLEIVRGRPEFSPLGVSACDENEGDDKPLH